MAIIKDFKGLRPKKEFVEKVVSPPYDVVSTEEARELAKDNPYSFLHVIRPEIDLPPSISIYDEEVYKKAKENLEKLIKDGIMFQDDEPYIYIYRQIMGDHMQTGFVVGASVDDYEMDIIKKHELTREEKEMDRTKHILYTNANTGPVFLVYRANEETDSFLSLVDSLEPEYNFKSDDGIEHIFWVIKNRKTIEKIKNSFKKIDYLYVADGHHRSAAATRVRKIKQSENPDHTGEEEYNYFLSVVFPHNQMKIMAYNRVVKDKGALSDVEFIEKVKEKFDVKETELLEPSKKHEIVMFFKGKRYLLVPKEGTFNESDPVESLDVQILQKNLLSPVLGIENPRKDKRIDFVGGIKGAKYVEDKVLSGEYEIGFSMYPTSMDELLSVADSGKIMPPKSTWFEPKLKSGLVVHLLR